MSASAASAASAFPYHYNNKYNIHANIYGDYDIYYYSMRILRNYLSKLEKYQGIYKIDLDDPSDYDNLAIHIRDRVVNTRCELANDNTVYKIIRSINKDHFLRFIKAYCKNKKIEYTTNLNLIDIREFLAYVCGELINLYKSDIIDGWRGNKWEKVHRGGVCRIYAIATAAIEAADT
jgi:hypothetical protein